MHKDTMWAEKLISLQEEDGKWGCFHSLSASYGSPVTTERALRRLERLGFTIEDACIQKAVGYMVDCLAGKKRGKLQFVTEWLKRNQNQHGTWDMGKSVKDDVYFPLSDDWRKKETREADCTERISNLLGKLSE